MPHLSNAEVTSILGKAWKKLEPQKKNFYQRKYDANRKKFLRENPGFKRIKKTTVESKYISSFRLENCTPTVPYSWKLQTNQKPKIVVKSNTRVEERCVHSSLVPVSSANIVERNLSPHPAGEGRIDTELQYLFEF